jgi:hypothetical protein
MCDTVNCNPSSSNAPAAPVMTFLTTHLKIGGQKLTPDVVPVTFHLPGPRVPTARRVSVLGSFNQWNAQVHRLRKSPEGDWAITIYLSPGRIVYCFDVDGTAWLDLQDDGRVPNCWGSEYSVRNIAPPDEPMAVTEDAVRHEPTPYGAGRFAGKLVRLAR